MLDDAGQATNPFTLREYRHTDLDQIFRLDEVCFAPEFRFDRRSMQRFAEAGNAISLVIEHVTTLDTNSGAASIAGFAIVHVEHSTAQRRGYVVTLDVAPELRRCGLAGRLMDEMERRAAEARAIRMELHVFAENDAAIQFYEKRGYACLGMQRGFYGRGLDALVYRKTLG
jgi:[ribosomal protein S18]-alanine N-acetyltransferase